MLTAKEIRQLLQHVDWADDANHERAAAFIAERYHVVPLGKDDDLIGKLAEATAANRQLVAINEQLRRLRDEMAVLERQSDAVPKVTAQAK